MGPHVHISPIHGIAMVLFIIAVLGTLHLLSLTSDNRATRAIAGLGL